MPHRPFDFVKQHTANIFPSFRFAMLFHPLFLRNFSRFVPLPYLFRPNRIKNDIGDGEYVGKYGRLFSLLLGRMEQMHPREIGDSYPRMQRGDCRWNVGMIFHICICQFIKVVLMDYKEGAVRVVCNRCESSR